MDDRPVIWDRANRKHIEEDHPERRITVSEVEEAMNDPKREEAAYVKREGYWVVRGRTLADGKYPVHAHVIGRRGR